MVYNAEVQRAYRQRHPDRLRARQQEYRATHASNLRESRTQKSLANRAFMDSLLVSGCVDCGNKNLTVLDFDHQGDKKQNVSAMRQESFAAIEAEIAKCEVRCANCHRIATAARRKAA